MTIRSTHKPFLAVSATLARLCVLTAAICICAPAQRLLDGSVTGIVTDSSHAVVTGAEVDLTNMATGVVTRSVSNSAGVFNFPSVPVGVYELRVSKAGFKMFLARQITVETSESARIDAVLDVGSTHESVTVTASAPLLSKETSDLGTEVTHDMVTDLPLQVSGGVRNPFSFVSLTPGASGDGGAASGTRVAGGRQFESEDFVDGAPTSYNAWQNEPGPSTPPIEIVEEFRVETAVAPAEFGRTMSGSVLLVTRSGTNQLHGNLVGLFRNNVLDARSFNTAVASTERQAEYGGSLGGPVVIPKLYDGTNKTFFYANFTGYRDFTDNFGQVATVATAQEQAGNFSQVPQAIYDPSSAGANGLRTQFPGNIIPASRISPLALKMESYFPLPNAPGISSNFIGGLPLPDDSELGSLKIDHSITSNDRLSGSYRQTDEDNSTAPNGFVSATSALDHQLIFMKTVNLADDYVIQPNLVNHLQGNVSRFITEIAESQDIGVQVPGSFAAGYPGIRFTGQGFAGFGYQNNRTTTDTNMDYQESVAWTKGSHNMKFGARLDHLQYDLNQPGELAGYYTFTQTTTTQPQVANTGDSYASFLLGLVSTGAMTKNTPYTVNTWCFGVFAQDDWKVTRRLTINYGYRWEFQTPLQEMNHSMSIMDRNVPNPGAGNLPGAVIFAGTGPGRSGYNNFMDTYHGAHAPRLGLAYQLTGNTVIRAGAGLFYAPLSTLAVSSTGFTANSNVSSGNAGLTPAFQFDQGWPAGTVHSPPDLDPTVSNGSTTATTEWRPGGSDRLARTSQWQFSVQHTVGNLLLEADYVGTVGHGILNDALLNINQLPPQDLALGSLLTQNITAPQVVAAGYKPPYPGFTGTLAQALRPYPQYTTITTEQPPVGNSTYHALYLKSEKRLSHGLQYLVSYQYSKCLSDTSFTNTAIAGPQDQYNRAVQKALCNVNVPFSLTASFTYELPLGAGKPFLPHGPLAQLLGGWSVSGVLSYQSGMPLNVTTVDNLPLFTSQLRPNQVSGVPILVSPGRESFQPLNALTGQTGDLYLNPKAFSTPAPFTFGDLAPFLPTVMAPGSEVENLSLVRRFRIHERCRMELRADFFNAFNRRNLNAPVTDLTSSSFGQITGQASPRITQLGFRTDF